MSSFNFLAFAFLSTLVGSQSVQKLGIVGGSGHCGGIGDAVHPVFKAQSFITDATIPRAPNTTRQLAEGAPPVPLRSNATSGDCEPFRRIVIDSSPQGARQEMVGFGHAWTDSSVSVFNSLEPDVLDQLMQDLFGEDGNNMGFMRHSIGSSDLSYDQYSFDDNGPSFNEGEPDPDLAHFGLGSDGTAMVEMLATMGKYKSDVFLYGSPWSYPGWMKHNGLFVVPNLNVDGDGAYSILNNSFDKKFIPQVVDYFIKYIETYASHGVTVNGITLQNEPLNYQGGTTTMYLDAADASAILTSGLSAALRARNVIVLAYDHNTDQPAYPARVVEGAPGLVDGAAWHCYASPVADYSVLDDFRYVYPGSLQFMTECTSYMPMPGDYSIWVATHFMQPVRYGASGASMWVLATNPNYGPHSPYGGCAGCAGSIIVNSSTTYTKTHDYYMVGQFSRFVRRGAVNFDVLEGNEGSSLASHQFYIMAVQNLDQSWAVVFLNNMPTDQNIHLSFTSTDYIWQGIIPQSTVTTWLLPADSVLGSGNRTTTPTTPLPYANSTASRFSNSTVCSATAIALSTAGSKRDDVPPASATYGSCRREWNQFRARLE